MVTILRAVEEHIFANSTLCASPRFFGYINGSGNQAAVVAELLAAAVNQICAKWQFSQAASEVERRVIHWVAQFVGYGSDAGGCLVNGGSAGNFAGLAMARHHKAPFDTNSSGRWGGPPLTVYVSREGHASIDKSMALLGMGRGQLRRIAVRDDFTIDLDALAQQVATDRANGSHPICVVGNAGTTNTGAVCFQYRTSDVSRHHDQAYLDKLNSGLVDALARDGRVFLSGTKIRGKTALRACSVNHRLRRCDVDFLLEVIRDVAARAL